MHYKHSAGILAYHYRAGSWEVFLVHPGGPYWARRDQGAWSIPKGEYLEGESALAAAQREFHEETGLALSGRLMALTPLQQPGGKWVSAWAVEAADLNPAQLHSNCFTIEWPPHSHRKQAFPEVDRAAWWPLEQATVKLMIGQRPLLVELVSRLGEAPEGALRTPAPVPSSMEARA